MNAERPAPAERQESPAKGWLERRKLGIAALGKDAEHFLGVIGLVLPHMNRESGKISWPAVEVALHSLSRPEAELLRNIQEADERMIADEHLRQDWALDLKAVKGAFRDLRKKGHISPLETPTDILSRYLTVFEERWDAQVSHFVDRDALAIPKEVVGALESAHTKIGSAAASLKEPYVKTALDAVSVGLQKAKEAAADFDKITSEVYTPSRKVEGDDEHQVVSMERPEASATDILKRLQSCTERLDKAVCDVEEALNQAYLQADSHGTELAYARRAEEIKAAARTGKASGPVASFVGKAKAAELRTNQDFKRTIQSTLYSLINYANVSESYSSSHKVPDALLTLYSSQTMNLLQADRNLAAASKKLADIERVRSEYDSLDQAATHAKLEAEEARQRIKDEAKRRAAEKRANRKKKAAKKPSTTRVEVVKPADEGE